MEPEAQDIAEHPNHQRLLKAYLRLAAESKKIKESPGVTAIYGEAPTLKKKGKQPKGTAKGSVRLKYQNARFDR